ncbi:hypothetical protein KXD93_14525 [Mucilaginibacter sp. BJC16-A38]|uniref:hypothetical protein n=1 Tax=Mucilaginibacter phenanthrenivorans TaxID=1234842 RepID=UPI0021589D48|nr:hypothetical protein [Mucilaginibacter phenanthrenivorans]MCR8558868.1 hypothetical protein [Mucilaginibacter phenanthrenivorans]
MLTEISPKKDALYGRIILQIILFVALLYFIYGVIFPKGKHHLHDQAAKDWLLVLVALVFNIGFLIKLYSMPFWVIIDDESKTLTFKYLKLPPKNISIYDITGYATTTMKDRSQSYFGIYIYLDEGNRILLSDKTFYDYSPVERFLEQLKVKNLGEE